MRNFHAEPAQKRTQGELDSAAWTSPDLSALAELPLTPAHMQRVWQQSSETARQRADNGDRSMQVLDFYDSVFESRENICDEDDIWAIARVRQDAGDQSATMNRAETNHFAEKQVFRAACECQAT